VQLLSLHVHPVKSTAIRTVQRAAVLPTGLAGDRRWMVVDDTGTMVSARTDPRLFLITARTPELDGIEPDLVLSADGYGQTAVSAPQGEAHPYAIHSSTGHGIAAGPEADRWIGAVLGRHDVHLVWCPDPARRAVDQRYALPGDATAFADGYPVLLATAASMSQLNTWITELAAERGEASAPLPIARFRPNLVVDGEFPFGEDSWQVVEIGGVRFRAARRSSRCVMTTVAPDTLVRGPEPIRTLARHRRFDGKTWFGMNLIPEVAGTLTVGDQVRVIA